MAVGIAPVAAAAPAAPTVTPGSGNVDAIKLARLQAAAHGGSEGVAQFDAAQNSVGAQRATQAAGLAADAKSAGYSGPTMGGGAPTALLGQLGSGLSPYQQALSSGKANFSQDIAQGLAASENYLKEAQAAPRVGKGGSGGGGGGGSSKPISNTALLADLRGAAAQVRAQQLAAINLQGAQTETAATNTAVTQGGVANRLAEYNRFEAPQMGAHFNPDGTPKTTTTVPGAQIPGVEGPPKPTTAPIPVNPVRAQIAPLNQRYLGQKQFAEQVLPQDYRKAFLTTPSQEIENNPAIMAQLAAAGLSDRVPQVLTPQVDKSWLTATESLLGKTPAIPKGKAAPVPYQEAASQLGIPTTSAKAGEPSPLDQILGLSYTRDGYFAVDKNGLRSDQKGFAGLDHYVNDENKTVSAKTATGTLVPDVTALAQKAASQGLDFASFGEQLEASPYWSRAWNDPTLGPGMALALTVAKGLFEPSAAVPAQQRLPQVGYQIPDVRA